MTNLLRSVLLLSVAAAATPASAADKDFTFFGNIGYNYISAPESVDFSAIVLRAGARYGRFFGAEFEGAFGLGSDTVDVGGFDVRTKLNHTLAGYAVFSYPVSKHFEVFGRAGYVDVELSADAGFGRVTGSDGGFAGGVGAQYFFGGGKNGARFDYTRYELGGEGGGINSIAISYVRRF